MLRKIIIFGITVGLLYSQELPKLEIGTQPLPSVENIKTEVAPKIEESKLTKGLSYLDICTPKKSNSRDYSNYDNCREYYSKAAGNHLFTIDEFDLPTFFSGANGHKYKFITKIIVPQELIRDDKIYLTADSLNAEGSGEINGVNYFIKFHYFVNEEEIFGNNLLIELNGKNEIDLKLEVLFLSSQSYNFEKFNPLYTKDKKKLLNAINDLLNHNLTFQEKKRGKKKTIKLTSDHIGQIED